MEKKNMVFLSVIAVATLLTAVVGTTFSFFTATATPEDQKDYKDTTINTATLGVVYAQDSAINLANAVPGATANYTLSVHNNGNVAIDFNLVWKNVTNTIAAVDTAGDVTYKIESCGTDASCASSPTVVQAETKLPEAGSETITGASRLTISAGATNYYRVTVTIKETNAQQNNLQGKSFSGQVQIGAAAQSGGTLG